MNAPRPLTLLRDRFAVCRFAPDAALPAWVFHDSARLWCVMRTPDELSVVCPEDDLPPAVTRAERGWRALKVEGPIPFGEVGVIASLTAPLAAAGVPVFVLSTYDTDYVLVKEPDLDRARAALGGRIAPHGEPAALTPARPRSPGTGDRRPRRRTRSRSA